MPHAPSNMVTYLLEETESPFTEDILIAVMPDKFKLPYTKYNGTRDLTDNLEMYQS